MINTRFSGDRASLGKHLSMIIRFANTGRQLEDTEMMMHGNLTVGCLRKLVLRKVKSFAANLKVELYANGEMLDPIDDRRLISEIPAVKDKMVCSLTLKFEFAKTSAILDELTRSVFLLSC